MVSHEDSAPAVFEAERMAEPPVQYLVDRRLCSYRTDFPTLSLMQRGRGLEGCEDDNSVSCQSAAEQDPLLTMTLSQSASKS